MKPMSASEPKVQSLARELTLQLLYLLDSTNGENVARQMEQVLEMQCENREARELAREYYRGVTDALADIDARITETAVNWQLSRMPYIDRAILRIGAYELLFAHETPPKVAINEAVDLAKRYSTEKSGAFVNGVLDKIYQTHASKV
ncbi:MAG: transcription antitermination factor NusB [Planctomycetes bacterium]|jgi:N utilization substance protein B|nr:transcription antitermination factor NusB [Planctomycetota bacterium]